MALKPAAAFVALLALVGSPARGDPKLDASTYSFTGILFPSPKGHPFGYGIDWVAKPTLAQVEAALPADAKNAGRTQWSCAIGNSGLLADCNLQEEWPAKQGFANAARTLIPLFRVSSKDILESRRAQARAIVEVDLEDDSRMVQEIPGDCPPPFCVAVPPPPPPPPPGVHRADSNSSP